MLESPMIIISGTQFQFNGEVPSSSLTFGIGSNIQHVGWYIPITSLHLQVKYLRADCLSCKQTASSGLWMVIYDWILHLTRGLRSANCKTTVACRFPLVRADRLCWTVDDQWPHRIRSNMRVEICQLQSYSCKLNRQADCLSSKIGLWMAIQGWILHSYIQHAG